MEEDHHHLLEVDLALLEEKVVNDWVKMEIC